MPVYIIRQGNQSHKVEAETEQKALAEFQKVKPKKEKTQKLDLNKDGKVDSEDATIAAKTLNHVRHNNK